MSGDATMSGRSKVVDLRTAVASVPEGASLSFSGFGHFGHPLAFVHELLRAGTGGFTLHAIAECWPAELLTAAGRVRHIDMSNLMFEGLGRVRAICRAVENGEITTDDHSHLGLTLRLLAGGWDVPFLPLRTMAGSDLENIQTGLPASAGGRVPDELYALFPVLYDMRGRKSGNLSGGQQQQLAIARALATNPKVLLLDEPTEGIQPSIIKDIARALKEIRKLRQLTIVVSEQVLSFTLDIADRFLVIDKGRFVYEETRDKVDAATISRYLSV